MLGGIDCRRLAGETHAAAIETAQEHHQRPEPNDHGGIVLILTHAVATIVKRNNEFVVVSKGKVAIIVLGRGCAEGGKASHSVESKDRSGDDSRENDTVKARAATGTEGAHVMGPNSN